MSDFDFESQYDPKGRTLEDVFLSVEDLRGLLLQLREDTDRLQSPQEGNLLRLRSDLSKMKAGDLFSFDGSKNQTSLVRIPLSTVTGAVLTSRVDNVAWILPNNAATGMVNANLLILPRP